MRSVSSYREFLTYKYSIKVGCIHKLTGVGEEWLIGCRCYNNEHNAKYVMARFLNGNFITIDMGCPTLEESLAPTKICA